MLKSFKYFYEVDKYEHIQSITIAQLNYLFRILSRNFCIKYIQVKYQDFGLISGSEIIKFKIDS